MRLLEQIVLGLYLLLCFSQTSIQSLHFLLQTIQFWFDKDRILGAIGTTGIRSSGPQFGPIQGHHPNLIIDFTSRLTRMLRRVKDGRYSKQVLENLFKTILIGH